MAELHHLTGVKGGRTSRRKRKKIRIIQCGLIYFFTAPLSLVGSLTGLVAESEKIEVELLPCEEEPYFALLMRYFQPPGDEEVQATRAALKHTWDELVRRGISDQAEMPEPILGNPLDMCWRAI